MKTDCIAEVSVSRRLSDFPPHRHNYYLMLYIAAGSAELNVAGKTVFAAAPAVVFISNLENHSVKPAGNTYCRYSVALRPESTGQCIRRPELLSVFTDRPEGFSPVFDVTHIKEKLDKLFSLLYTEKREESDVCELLLQSILTVIYNACAEQFPVYNPAIGDTVAWLKNLLENEYAENFTLDELARRVNVSRYYLSHSFKSVTGYGVRQYQILCRIAAAKEKLAVTDMPVSDICFEVGFSDLSNFSRYFGKTVGCTPSEYRKKVR